MQEAKHGRLVNTLFYAPFNSIFVVARQKDFDNEKMNVVKFERMNAVKLQIQEVYHPMRGKNLGPLDQ